MIGELITLVEQLGTTHNPTGIVLPQQPCPVCLAMAATGL